MSDEIGHCENCPQLDAENTCAVPGTQDPGGLDEDDDNNFCVPGSDSTLVMINGCFSDDEDWDGQSYRNNHFGGSSTTEFGRLLQTVYPAAGFTTVRFFNNFNSGDTRNPCPVG